MQSRLNENILLWAVAVLQPASAADVRTFIASIYPEISPLPNNGEIENIFSSWRQEGYLQRVHGKSRLYSATYKANSKLSIKLRRSRDKARIFLLKSARDVSQNKSGVREQDSVGDSPPTEGSRQLQEGSWPIKPASVPRDPRTTNRFYWSRVSKQLNLKVGPVFSSPDTFFNYYSFPSIKSIHEASDKAASEKDLSITDLSLAIGVSPRLITSFIHAHKNHYRQFKIGKRGGGERVINSPRTFLKVVQYWILDYLLHSLPCHPNCHSYKKGKSILSNSLPHVRQKYVANIDISNFFPSISEKMVTCLLRDNKLGEQLSQAVARIVTLEDGLPQGAPTSPIISNALLNNFDEIITQQALSFDLVYTRYADDITISGGKKENIISLIKNISMNLKDIGFSVNEKKTRIASHGGQQKVTGIVVNEISQPPRSYRRNIRSMFHHAEISPKLFENKISMLKGHISYLQSFPNMQGKKELIGYRDVCKKIEKISIQQIK